MNTFEKLEELENKVKAILGEAKKDKEEEPSKSEEEEEKAKEDHMFDAMSGDDVVEEFIDGMIFTLSELQQSGRIPEIKDATHAKAAIIAAIRRMYQKRSLIAKQSRLFARFGAKRILQRARRELNKSLSK